jgi:Glycosyl hydrolases family 6
MLFGRKDLLLVPLFSRSYQLTQQPHAVWLSGAEQTENIARLNTVLNLAVQQGSIPEVVLYTIPNRDLGKASEGGATDGKTYLTNNLELAKMLKVFIAKTDKHPVVYLEPDAIAHLLPAIYRRTPDLYPSWVRQRLWLLKQSVGLFKQAGCNVFLDVGHGEWVATPQQRDAMVRLLLQAGLKQCTGIVSNISNFQPIATAPNQAIGEAHYLKTLMLLIRKVAPALSLQLRVDASRSLPPELYSQRLPRKFILNPKGSLWEEIGKGGSTTLRRIGHWRGDTLEQADLSTQFGASKNVEHLTTYENYTLEGNVLTAPLWLDPLMPSGKTPLGVMLPQRKIEGVETRWIKPPDEADGCLPYKAGDSVSVTDKHYQTISSAT